MGGGREALGHRDPLEMPAIRLVLGFSEGSMSDFVAAALAAPLSQRLGAAVTIERRLGKDGLLAAQHVAASAPDGSTLFIATFGTHVLAPLFSPVPGYDPVRSLRPVCLLSKSPMILACHPSLGASTVSELITIAQTQSLKFASSALWGAPHLAGELFSAMAKVPLMHMIYEQTGQLYQDLVGGRVALSFNNVMSMAPHVRRGALTGIAVMGTERDTHLPDVPTMAESGLPGCEVTNWLGVVAPADTPTATVNALNAEIAAALRHHTVAEPLRQAGANPCGDPPEAFLQHIEDERARWKAIRDQIFPGDPTEPTERNERRKP